MEMISEEIMNELYIRFLQDSKNLKNIFSTIEEMHWFYLDQFFTKLSTVNVDLIDFATQVFKRFPRIIPKNCVWEEEFDNWKLKKSKTPTSSAVIMDFNLQMVIMVKGFGSKRWTFPGGKKETESFKQCAIREVDEEIGFDISNKIEDDLCITLEKDGVKRCHYIICNVPLNTKFRPKTNNEIEKISWFPLKDLPESKQDDCFSTINAHAKDFIPTMNVIRIIKKWVLFLNKNSKIKALELAMKQVHIEDGISNKPRSKSVSDVKEVSKTIQNSNLLATKNKMLLVRPGKPKNMDSLWLGIQFNKEEFLSDLHRNLWH